MSKILVVDDAQFMRMVLKNILNKQGHEVVEAENGKDAVKKYHAESPDLVMMDITMPEMDGIAAVNEIMKSDPQASIIMCSAMGQQAMVVEAIKSGAKDFIVKPFEAERIVTAVNKVLKR